MEPVDRRPRHLPTSAFCFAGGAVSARLAGWIHDLCCLSGVWVLENKCASREFTHNILLSEAGWVGSGLSVHRVTAHLTTRHQVIFTRVRTTGYCKYVWGYGSSISIRHHSLRWWSVWTARLPVASFAGFRTGFSIFVFSVKNRPSRASLCMYNHKILSRRIYSFGLAQ